MKQLTAKETLSYVIRVVTEYLNEIQRQDPNNQDDFTYGAKTAYVECLEMIQFWEEADNEGLDYNIEDLYPL